LQKEKEHGNKRYNQDFYYKGRKRASEKICKAAIQMDAGNARNHEQAEDNLKKVSDILSLYGDMKTKMAESTHSQYAIRALYWIFEYPVFNGTTFVKKSEIPKPTARRILTILRSKGILKELAKARGSRSANLCFPKLLNLAEGREVF
jgi:hypothetical protein